MAGFQAKGCSGARHCRRIKATCCAMAMSMKLPGGRPPTGPAYSGSLEPVRTTHMVSRLSEKAEPAKFSHIGHYRQPASRSRRQRSSDETDKLGGDPLDGHLPCVYERSTRLSADPEAYSDDGVGQKEPGSYRGVAVNDAPNLATTPPGIMIEVFQYGKRYSVCPMALQGNIARMSLPDHENCSSGVLGRVNGVSNSKRILRTVVA